MIPWRYILWWRWTSRAVDTCFRRNPVGILCRCTRWSCTGWCWCVVLVTRRSTTDMMPDPPRTPVSTRSTETRSSGSGVDLRTAHRLATIRSWLHTTTNERRKCLLHAHTVCHLNCRTELLCRHPTGHITRLVHQSVCPSVRLSVCRVFENS